MIPSVPGREPPPLALAYHGVADVAPRRDPDNLFVRASDLSRHIERLERWGYRFVTFGELAERASGGEHHGCVALTFDDGFADNLSNLAPVLAARRVPATVFVVSGWLGARHPAAPSARLLDAAQLRELHGAGVEIGAHTVTHPDLTTLDSAAARDELERSRTELEGVIQAPVTVAAYPRGRASAATRAACRAAGFRAACRTTGEGSWDDPYDLPRQDMENASSTLSLRLKRDGRYEPLMRWRAARAGRRALRLARGLTR